MVIYKRTLLILLLCLAFVFMGYQIYLVIQPLFLVDNETKFTHLVDEYQLLKMERLVLEEQYALAHAKNKIGYLTGEKPKNINFALKDPYSPSRKQILPKDSALALGVNSATEPIALSLEQAKTFEQLEAYVSNSKPLQPQTLTKDEKGLLQAQGEDFTLQLMGVRDPSELTRFMNENNLKDAHVFHTFYLDKDWFVLVCGCYKNHTEAVKAIDSLPDNIKSLKPWIRQLSSVQRAIQLYR